MQQSLTSKIAKVMVEINSRLSGLAEGQYMLSIKSGKKSVYLNRMTYKDNTLQTGPMKTTFKKFDNYEELHPYLIAFNDGLDFAGLSIF